MASTTPDYGDSEHYEYDKIGMKAAIDQAIAATAAGKMPFGFGAVLVWWTMQPELLYVQHTIRLQLRINGVVVVAMAMM
jgi:hypothetical protein